MKQIMKILIFFFVFFIANSLKASDEEFFKVKFGKNLYESDLKKNVIKREIIFNNQYFRTAVSGITDNKTFLDRFGFKKFDIKESRFSENIFALNSYRINCLKLEKCIDDIEKLSKHFEDIYDIYSRKYSRDFGTGNEDPWNEYEYLELFGKNEDIIISIKYAKYYRPKLASGFAFALWFGIYHKPTMRDAEIELMKNGICDSSDDLLFNDCWIDRHRLGFNEIHLKGVEKILKKD